MIFVTQFPAAGGAEPEIQAERPLVIKIETSARKEVTFTLKGTAKLEIKNDKFNIAVSSREGMIFELTGIPAKDGIAARRYRGPEFRALLLHSPFQEEAASDDPFEGAAMLQIRQTGAEEAGGGASVEIKYSGKLRAGVEILDVQFQFSGSLPANGKFIIPTQ